MTYGMFLVSGHVIFYILQVVHSIIAMDFAGSSSLSVSMSGIVGEKPHMSANLRKKWEAQFTSRPQFCQLLDHFEKQTEPARTASRSGPGVTGGHLPCGGAFAPHLLN